MLAIIMMTPGQGRGNGTDEDVAVLHMGEFMCQDAGQLALIHHTQNSLGDRHGRVFGIPTRGKGVRPLGGDNIQLGHGQPGPNGQGVHNAVELRRVGFRGLLAAVHFETILSENQ